MVQAAVLQRFIEQFGGRDVLDADLISRRLGKIYYSAGRQYFREGCFAQSAAALATALTYRPTVKARALRVVSSLLRPFGKRDERDVPQL